MNQLYLKFNLEDSLLIDFNNYLFVTGGNDYKKNVIVDLFKYYENFKRFNPIETTYYGESPIRIMYNDKQVTPKNHRIICISDRYDLLKQVSKNKDSLLYPYLMRWQDDLKVSQILSEIESKVIALEQILAMNELSPLQISSESFNYTHLFNLLNIQWMKDEQLIPDYCVSLSDLYQCFLHLLEWHLEYSTSPIWLMVDSRDLPHNTDLKKFITQLKTLSFANSNLKCIFVNYPIDIINEYDFESLLICGNYYHQLPDFDTFIRSLSNYYPGKLTYSLSQLILPLCQVIESVGSINPATSTLSSKSLILLDIVGKLLDDSVNFETSNDYLTDQERDYLRKNLNKF